MLSLHVGFSFQFCSFDLKSSWARCRFNSILDHIDHSDYPMRHFSDSVDPDLFSVSASVRMLFFSAQSGFFFVFFFKYILISTGWCWIRCCYVRTRGHQGLCFRKPRGAAQITVLSAPCPVRQERAKRTFAEILRPGFRRTSKPCVTRKKL